MVQMFRRRCDSEQQQGGMNDVVNRFANLPERVDPLRILGCYHYSHFAISSDLGNT